MPPSPLGKESQVASVEAPPEAFTKELDELKEHCVRNLLVELGHLEEVDLGSSSAMVVRLLPKLVAGIENLDSFSAADAITIAESKGRTIGGQIAHELNNVLSVPLGYIELLMDIATPDMQTILNRMNSHLKPLIDMGKGINPYTDDAANIFHSLGTKNASPAETILLVDDEESIRDLVSESLQNDGYRVITAESGKSALEHVDTADVVVTDITMPGMSGIQFHRLSQEQSGDKPFLFMSGFSNAEIPEGYRVITKPFRMSELTDAIRIAITDHVLRRKKNGKHCKQ